MATCNHCSLSEATHACGECKNAVYCSTACQSAAWPLHAIGCKTILARNPDDVAVREPAVAFLRFVDASPTAYHAAETCAFYLKWARFKELAEEDQWTLERGGRYFYVRGGSTIVAFVVGSAYEPGDGLHFIATHTDSVALKIKSSHSAAAQRGYDLLALDPYSSARWHTWINRDLGVAGRVFTRPAMDTRSRDYAPLRSHLVHIKEPLFCIPGLAIHLSKERTDEGAPVLALLGTTGYERKLGADKLDADDFAPPSVPPTAKEDGKHHAAFMGLLARELKLASCSEIASFDLSLCDIQPAALGGIHREFIFAPRIDNLLGTFCAIRAFVDTAASASPPKRATNENSARMEERNIRGFIAFDHEEVGSGSAHGARSPLVDELMRRVLESMMNLTTTETTTSKTRDAGKPGAKPERETSSGSEGGPDPLSASASSSRSTPSRSVAPRPARSFEQLLARSARRSFLLSCDMGHATHPTLGPSRVVWPALHGGPVLHYSANQSLATSAESAALIKEVARHARVSLQENQQDRTVSRGSTVGPIISTRSGIRAADVGITQLSMHSIREVASIHDVALLVDFLRTFYDKFSTIDNESRKK